MSNIKTEIAGLVVKKVKIPQAQAEMAVDVALDFVKKKLPPAVHPSLRAADLAFWRRSNLRIMLGIASGKSSLPSTVKFIRYLYKN